jgi:hypothetical protein
MNRFAKSSGAVLRQKRSFRDEPETSWAGLRRVIEVWRA